MSTKACVRVFLFLALSITFSTAVFARDEAPPRPVLMTPPSSAESPAFGARTDTLYLFSASGPGSFGSPGTDVRGFTFDHAGGEPAESGWFGVDNTAQTGNWWHLAGTALCAGTGTDMSQALPFDTGDTMNDYALWCGRSAVCGWQNPDGYGNNWQQYASVDLSAHPITTELQVDFAYRADFEGGRWDWFELRVEVDGEWDPALRNDISAERSFREYSVTIPAADLGGAGSATRLGFFFFSDGGWSDQDGSFLSDLGAVWLDNIVATVDGTEVFAADFEDGLEPAELSLWAPDGAGSHADLYGPLFHEDVCIENNSQGWTFHGYDTTNPNYPIPVISYGPPFVDEDLESPMLEVDQHGQPLQFGDSDALRVSSWVYFDMPLNALIFTRKPAVAARVAEQSCLGEYRRENVVFYGDDKSWIQWDDSRTSYLRESAAGNTITGVKVRIGGVKDMCQFWCNLDGDGSEHTPGAYFDNIRVYVVPAEPAIWDLEASLRLQDSFPEMSGRVRIDAALDLQDNDNGPLVVADSTVIGLDMASSGGLATSYNSEAGELRPELRLLWRIVAGPHEGLIETAQADPDAADGIWSPWAGSIDFNGESWGSMQADHARRDGQVPDGRFAFDFDDDYFEPGDIIEFLYRAESTDGSVVTYPEDALNDDPDLRSYHRVRCLPTAGYHVLFVEDELGVGASWELAFEYSCCTRYDVYSTQASSSGLNNGLACRAELTDLNGYELILWDSGGLSHYTMSTPASSQLCSDTTLLQSWLAGATSKSGLWVFGNEIATDLDDQDPEVLAQLLGVRRVFNGNYFDDITGVLEPWVGATHGFLRVMGLEPYYSLDGGCPYPMNRFDLIEVEGALSEESHRWHEDGGTDIVAGVLNRDPDGNGTDVNSQGVRNWVLFNPFSYSSVRDEGFLESNGAPGIYTLGMIREITDIFWRDGYRWCCETAAPETPAVTALTGAYPNPFNPRVMISFSLAKAGHATLDIYDISGRRLRTLLDGQQEAGAHELEWNGRNDDGRRLASGVYFLRFEAGDVEEREKLLLLK